MNESSEDLNKQIIILIVSLCLSIIIGFIPNWTGVNFTVPEQTILTIGIFISFSLIDVLWIVTKSSSFHFREYKNWITRNKGEEILSNIRSCFSQVVKDAYSPKDLYVLYFLEEFEQLAHRIKDAAEKQELRVTSSHLFVTENLLDSTSYGSQNLIIRYIWVLNDKERLFEDYPWRRYFEQLTLMTQEGSVKSIRTIFILEDLKFAEVPRNKLFLDFFKTNKGFDCHIIKASDFRNLSTQNNISLSYIDFGIYGDRILFRTEQYVPETIGSFTKDQSLIRIYTIFFDILWNSIGITMRNPSTATKQVTLEELFKFDAEQPIEFVPNQSLVATK